MQKLFSLHIEPELGIQMNEKKKQMKVEQATQPLSIRSNNSTENFFSNCSAMANIVKKKRRRKQNVRKINPNRTHTHTDTHPPTISRRNWNKENWRVQIFNGIFFIFLAVVAHSSSSIHNNNNIVKRGWFYLDGSDSSFEGKSLPSKRCRSKN